MRRTILTVALILILSTAAWADGDERLELLQKSIQVMDEIMNSPDKGVPTNLIANAKAIIIFPTMLKGGFIFAAGYGKGVATVRSKDTGKWSPPAFLTTVGGSFGFQIGAEAVDLILLVMTPRGIEGLLKDQFTLGADAAIAAGPVGRHAEASADVLMQGEIYSYSRSKGAFAGISLKGSVITADKESNEVYYGQPLTPAEILLQDKVKKPAESTLRFQKEMSHLAPSASAKK